MHRLSKLLIIILFCSCASSKTIELGNKASQKGTEVSQRAIEIYQLLGKQSFVEKSQQDELDVLNAPLTELMDLPDNDINDFSDQLLIRIEAYKRLLKTYELFTLLTDSKYSNKTQDAISSLENSVSSIKAMPDLPEGISEKLPEISKLISQALQAKKVKKHNQIFFNLTEVYVELWDEDEKIWKEYLDFIYNGYSDGLNSVNSARYDAKKISEISKSPYSDESIIILMYRLDLRNEITKQKNEIKKQLDDFSKALRELNKVHAEISKSKTNISDVSKMINNIENLLSEK